MTTKNTQPEHTKSEHHLVSKFREVTSNFENELLELIAPAKQLPVDDRNKIISELKGTIQNIGFMLTSTLEDSNM